MGVGRSCLCWTPHTVSPFVCWRPTNMMYSRESLVQTILRRFFFISKMIVSLALQMRQASPHSWKHTKELSLYGFTLNGDPLYNDEAYWRRMRETLWLCLEGQVNLIIHLRGQSWNSYYVDVHVRSAGASLRSSNRFIAWGQKYFVFISWVILRGCCCSTTKCGLKLFALLFLTGGRVYWWLYV